MYFTTIKIHVMLKSLDEVETRVGKMKTGAPEGPVQLLKGKSELFNGQCKATNTISYIIPFFNSWQNNQWFDETIKSTF